MKGGNAGTWAYKDPPMCKSAEKKMASHDAAELVKQIDAAVEAAQMNPTDKVCQAVEQFAAALVLDYVDRRLRRARKGGCTVAVKPMLFNTEMVRALLDGRKSVTRRTVKGVDNTAEFIELEKNPSAVAIDKHGEEFPKEIKGLYACFSSGVGAFPLIKAPCRPGDILYVRETWDRVPVSATSPDNNYYYRADGDLWPSGWRDKWRPSIHMPKEAARLFLWVTGVRVERLQEMTEMDATRDFDLCPEAIKAVGMEPLCKSVWDSTIKKADLSLYGWAASPWVWVIEFDRCEKP